MLFSNNAHNKAMNHTALIMKLPKYCFWPWKFILYYYWNSQLITFVKKVQVTQLYPLTWTFIIDSYDLQKQTKIEFLKLWHNDHRRQNNLFIYNIYLLCYKSTACVNWRWSCVARYLGKFLIQHIYSLSTWQEESNHMLWWTLILMFIFIKSVVLLLEQYIMKMKAEKQEK